MPLTTAFINAGPAARALALSLGALLGALSGVNASAASSDDNANAVVTVFANACVVNAGSPDKTRAWANQKALPEVTGAQGRAVYVGDDSSDGTAWLLHGSTTDVVLAIKSNGACAVYASKADAEAMQTWFDKIVNLFASRGQVSTDTPDQSTQGTYGLSVNKARRVKLTDAPTSLLFSVTTNQQPGGPYQVSMQVNVVIAAKESTTPAPSGYHSTGIWSNFGRIGSR